MLVGLFSYNCCPKDQFAPKRYQVNADVTDERVRRRTECSIPSVAAREWNLGLISLHGSIPHEFERSGRCEPDLLRVKLQPTFHHLFQYNIQPHSFNSVFLNFLHLMLLPGSRELFKTCFPCNQHL
jgi:hypothetical protein